MTEPLLLSCLLPLLDERYLAWAVSVDPSSFRRRNLFYVVGATLSRTFFFFFADPIYSRSCLRCEIGQAVEFPLFGIRAARSFFGGRGLSLGIIPFSRLQKGTALRVYNYPFLLLRGANSPLGPWWRGSFL